MKLNCDEKSLNEKTTDVKRYAALGLLRVTNAFSSAM